MDESLVAFARTEEEGPASRRGEQRVWNPLPVRRDSL